MLVWKNIYFIKTVIEIEVEFSLILLVFK
jgi:hypothetical protein